MFCSSIVTDITVGILHSDQNLFPLSWIPLGAAVCGNYSGWARPISVNVTLELPAHVLRSRRGGGIVTVTATFNPNPDFEDDFKKMIEEKSRSALSIRCVEHNETARIEGTESLDAATRWKREWKKRCSRSERQ